MLQKVTKKKEHRAIITHWHINCWLSGVNSPVLRPALVSVGCFAARITAALHNSLIISHTIALAPSHSLSMCISTSLSVWRPCGKAHPVCIIGRVNIRCYPSDARKFLLHFKRTIKLHQQKEHQTNPIRGGILLFLLLRKQRFNAYLMMLRNCYVSVTVTYLIIN